MNTLKYTFIILFTFIAGLSIGQKMDGYILTLPAQILDGGGKVYVEDFKNSSGEASAFGKEYASALKNALNAERVAIGSVGKIQNPWITTKIYEVTDSKTDADYIITGEYDISSSSKSSNNPVYIKETSASLDPKIPVCYYNYTVSNSATVKGNVFLNSKGQVEPLKSLPFTKKSGKSKTKALEEPNVPSASKYISYAEKDAIKEYQYYLSPIIKSKKYKFKNLKGEDRSYNKQLRKQEREIKDLADKGDAMTMGKMYSEIITHQLKDMKDGYLNVGMCYEIIGNYTKAKEFYEKSGDKRAIQELNKLIIDRDKLVALGLNVVEKDFE